MSTEVTIGTDSAVANINESTSSNSRSKCWSVSNGIYDILTVLVSLADVITDIIVLIGFYNQDRIVFFGISLSILILSQCAYSLVFMLRFHVLDGYNESQTAAIFCCLLPFGSFVSFCMYLVEVDHDFDDKYGASFCNPILDLLNLNAEDFFPVLPSDSEITKWVIRKICKHIGFVLEAAIEAFPQSLLQLISIVYYGEANYISIISIIISMLSVMTKSLIFSQGIEFKTFIWTWLCIVTDFFGIFFVVSWIFYTDHENTGIDSSIFNIGFFNIFGEIYLIKMMCSSLLIAAIGVIIYFSYYCCRYLKDIYDDQYHHYVRKIFNTFFLLLMSTVGVLIICGAAIILMEVFCFGFLAGFCYRWCTWRWNEYYSANVNETLKDITKFLKSKDKYLRNDRIVRIMALNYAITSLYGDSSHMLEYIDHKKKNENYESFQSVTYAEIRNETSPDDTYKLKANFFPFIWHLIVEFEHDVLKDIKRGRNSPNITRKEYILDIAFFICFNIGVFFIIPLFILSKIFQILFPYIIVCYLCNQYIMDHVMWWYEINLFQLCMLFIYIGLQWILLILGICVCRLHWFLWHIAPGNWSVDLTSVNQQKCISMAQKFYQQVQSYPVVEKILISTFGQDIGGVVFYYFLHIEIPLNGEEN